MIIVNIVLTTCSAAAGQEQPNQMLAQPNGGHAQCQSAGAQNKLILQQQHRVGFDDIVQYLWFSCYGLMLCGRCGGDGT